MSPKWHNKSTVKTAALFSKIEYNLYVFRDNIVTLGITRVQEKQGIQPLHNNQRTRKSPVSKLFLA